jgi:hypothetical protein
VSRGSVQKGGWLSNVKISYLEDLIHVWFAFITGPCHYPGKYTINVYMFIIICHNVSPRMFTAQRCIVLFLRAFSRLINVAYGLLKRNQIFNWLFVCVTR